MRWRRRWPFALAAAVTACYLLQSGGAVSDVESAAYESEQTGLGDTDTDSVADNHDGNRTVAVHALHFRKKRVDMEPMMWRHNRKKIKELTSITTVKGAQVAADVEPPALAVPPVRQPQPVMHWLAEQLGFSRSGNTEAAHEITASAVVAARERRKNRRDRARQSHLHSGDKTDRLCIELQRQHGVVARSTWGSLPPGQRESWQVLGCDGRVERVEMEAERAATAEHSIRRGRGSSDSSGVAKARAHFSSDSSSNRQRMPREQGQLMQARIEQAPSTAAAACATMQQVHAVVIGHSWGSLNAELRRRWTVLECDRELQGLHSRVGAAVSATPDHGGVSVGTDRGSHRADESGTDGGDERSVSTLSVEQQQVACRRLQRMHSVQIGRDWGTLSRRGQQRWTRLNCDRWLRYG